jgi:hypothetical protein
MSRTFERLGAIAFFAAAVGVAQEDLTSPPRILDTPRPAEARLAAGPGTSTDEQTIEEIIVTGDDNPWRLPDLGSEWRAREAERRPQERIRAEVFPLWNPEVPQPARDLFPVINEMRVGFIEVFRVRFGGRR